MITELFIFLNPAICKQRIELNQTNLLQDSAVLVQKYQNQSCSISNTVIILLVTVKSLFTEDTLTYYRRKSKG